MRKIALSLGAAALAMAPVAASAVESVQFSRAVEPVEDGSNVAGAPSILIAIFAAAAVVGGIAIASSEDDDGDDLPISG